MYDLQFGVKMIYPLVAEESPYHAYFSGTWFVTRTTWLTCQQQST